MLLRNYPWLKEAINFTGLSGLMLIMGIISGQITLALLIACWLYMGWHWYNLYRLEMWFHMRKKAPVLHASGIWGDVFARVYRLQQRNRKRKRKLSSILKRFRRSTEAMPDGAVILGPSYEIEWFNRASQQLLGLQSPQDKGKLIVNLIRYPNFSRYLQHHPEQGNDSLEFASPIDPNLMLRVSIVPYAGNQHLMLIRDITQLHRLEQVRRDFIANVSHELRTPLTVITGFVETMQDTEDACAQQWERPLMLMAQQADRMRSIVDDLLLLSRLESEQPLSMLQPVRVADLLYSICEEAKVLSGEQAHHISLDADASLAIYGNRDELRSAFSNLVFNAVRYTAAKGEIAVCWYADAEGVHFCVKDTGEGIAAEHIPRLTERFYRVDVARSRSQGGTGLGLAIVKHVLNRHEGHLHITSELGKGSTFCCNFPYQVPSGLQHDKEVIMTKESLNHS